MKKLFILFILFIIIISIGKADSPDFNIAYPIVEKVYKEYGIYAKRRVLALVYMMNKVKDQDELEKLKQVNDFFNRTPYGSDIDVWGISDYWATRIEFIGKDKGDCEDYVIAKYFTLKELGVAPSKMYMTYAKSVRYNAAHMVLTYYETPDSIPLVLDNYNFNIFPATQRKDLIPIFSFKGDDLFKAKQAQIGKIAPAAARQARPWDELIITQ